MNIWDPFHPLAYVIHTSLGVAAVLGAILALAVTKGSSAHILAGRTFAVGTSVVAAIAIAFSLTSFAPMAIASAVLAISAIGSAFLALRTRSTRVIAGELVTTMLMALVLLWLLFGTSMSVPQGGDLLWIPPLVLAACSAALLANDIRFIRQDDAGREEKRLPRHLSRMAFAFAIAVQAPIVVFADRLNIDPILAFYGPFLIWPVVAFFFNIRMKRNLVKIVDFRVGG